MKEFDYTTQFQKDWKKNQASKVLTKELMTSFGEVARILQVGGQLPREYVDHPLSGNWKNHRDFHLLPDLVVIYKPSETKVVFVRIGSHSEVF